jgi:hypothetical protein
MGIGLSYRLARLRGIDSMDRFLGSLKVSIFGPIAGICKPIKEPRNRFLAWRAGTTTLFDVPTRYATWLAESIPWNRFVGSLKVYKYELCTRSLNETMQDKFWTLHGGDIMSESSLDSTAA